MATAVGNEQPVNIVRIEGSSNLGTDQTIYQVPAGRYARVQVQLYWDGVSGATYSYPRSNTAGPPAKQITGPADNDAPQEFILASGEVIANQSGTVVEREILIIEYANP